MSVASQRPVMEYEHGQGHGWRSFKEEGFIKCIRVFPVAPESLVELLFKFAWL